MAFAQRMLTVLLGALLLIASPAAAERIVAVGDIHGDYEAFLDIVEAAGLSDDERHWTGGDTVLVQLGDLTDRGPDSLKVIRHLQALERAAAKTGGKVIVLVGNHEAMNMTGDLRYVDPGEYAAFATRNSDGLRNRLFEANRESIVGYYRKLDPGITAEAARQRWMNENPAGKIERRLAWLPSGDIGKWIVGKPAIARIGDTLFVHGGISVETAARPIEEINAEVAAKLAEGESAGHSILTDEVGPLWYRGNILRDPVPPAAEGEPPVPQRPSIAEELAQVLAAYGARRLVIGHTPNLAGIVTDCGGSLVRIDTGITAHYGGVHSYLELEDGQATAWQRDDGKWVSHKLQSPQ